MKRGKWRRDKGEARKCMQTWRGQKAGIQKKKMQSKKTEEGVRIFGKGRTEKVREGSEGENRDGIIKYK